MRIFLLFIFLLCCIGEVLAQQPVPLCGTDLFNNLVESKNPLLKLQREQADTALATSISSGHAIRSHNAAQQVYSIPVVFHIVHTDGVENISDAAVERMLTDLNDAVRNRNSYAQANGIDLQVEFCLAQQDESGAFTTGITRDRSSLTDMALETQDIDLKNISRWDPRHYLNIWVVREISSITVGNGVAGYASFPSSHGQPSDGIVVEARWIGSSHDNSKILIHEVGHYMNLYHTFQGGCANNNCLLDGDRVCDTPPDGTTTPSACGVSPNSCDSDDDDPSTNNPFRATSLGGLGDQPDLFIDYMDYGYQQCQKLFTPGQGERAAYGIGTLRQSLLESRGCLSPCPDPISGDLQPLDSILTLDTTLTFTVITSATNISWLFNGTAVGNGTSFTHTFNKLSRDSITVILSNGDPSCTRILTRVIRTVTKDGLNTDWTEVGQRFIPINPRRYGCAIIGKDSTIWAGQTSVWASEDLGTTWKKILDIDSNISEVVAELAIFDKSHGIVAAGQQWAYVTEDGGNTWRTLSGNVGDYCYSATYLDAPGQYALGFTSGASHVDVTEDNGASWRRSQFTQPVFQVKYLYPNRILAITSGNQGTFIYVSSDRGVTWHQQTNTAFDYDCWSIAIDACDSNVFYVVNEDFAAIEPKQDIFVSSDRGISWTTPIKTNALHYTGGIATGRYGSVFIQTFDDGVYRSSDRGTTWEFINGPAATPDSRSITTVGDTIVFALDAYGSVWRSMNAAQLPPPTSSEATLTIELRDAQAEAVGGTVFLPIYIHTPVIPPSVECSLHFDSMLIYKGSQRPDGTPIDISGSATPTSARIHLNASQIPTDGLAGYALFDVIAGNGEIFGIYCDSITIPNAPANVCQNIVTITGIGSDATISAPIGCGSSILAEWWRTKNIAGIAIYPNPASSVIHVKSLSGQRPLSIELFDMLGAKALPTIFPATTQSLLTIDASELQNGLYHLQVRTSLASYSYPIVIQK